MQQVNHPAPADVFAFPSAVVQDVENITPRLFERVRKNREAVESIVGVNPANEGNHGRRQPPKLLRPVICVLVVTRRGPPESGDEVFKPSRVGYGDCVCGLRRVVGVDVRFLVFVLLLVDVIGHADARDEAVGVFHAPVDVVQVLSV